MRENSARAGTFARASIVQGGMAFHSKHLSARTLLFGAFLLCLPGGRALALSAISAADAPNATPGLLRQLNRGPETLAVVIGVADGTPSAKALLASPDPEGEPERRVLRVAAQKRLAEEMTSRM